jgi:hypothetical protein
MNYRFFHVFSNSRNDISSLRNFTDSVYRKSRNVLKDSIIYQHYIAMVPITTSLETMINIVPESIISEIPVEYNIFDRVKILSSSFLLDPDMSDENVILMFNGFEYNE